MYRRAEVAKARSCRGARQRAFDDMGAASAGIQRRRCPKLSVNGVAKGLSGLEGRHSRRGDGDGFAGLGVAAGTCRAVPDGEIPEPGDGDRLAPGEASLTAENKAPTAAAASAFDSDVAVATRAHSSARVMTGLPYVLDGRCSTMRAALSRAGRIGAEDGRGSGSSRSVRQIRRTRTCAHHRVHRRYIVIRSRSPNARVIRISVEKEGLRFAASAL